MILLGSSSSSLLAACLLCLFLGGIFPALRMFRVFSCSSGLPIRRSPACFSLELFLGFLSFWLLGFPVLSSPCSVSRLAALSLFLSVPGILRAYVVSSSVLFGGAPPSTFCSSTFSWVWSDPFYFSSPSLFGLFLEVLLSEFSSFLAFWSPLGSPFRSVDVSPGFLSTVGSVFLLSLPDWSVSSPGSPRL